MREGWEIKKISKTCKVINGGTPKTKVSKYWGDEILWITPKDMGQLESIYVSDTSRKISQLGLDNSSAKLIPENSIILSSRAPIGHLAINAKPMATNQGCKGIVPGDEINSKFLFYFLYKSVDLLNNLGSGTTFKELSSTSLKKVEIPIPPLPEQKRIVAILDEAFEALDQAKANIKRNIANAEELFQSKLNDIFSQQGEGWEEKKLGEACEISMGQSPKGSTYNDEGIGTPLINGPVEFGPNPFSKTIMSKWTTDPNKMCKPGDLILCVRGSTTGRINIAGFEACIGRGVASIRYEKNQNWLNFFIRANQENIYKMGSGSTFPNVSGKILKKIDFPEPPVEVQNKLIKTMSELVENTNHILELYEKKLEALEELKKSILQQAFSGQLTGEPGWAGWADEQDGVENKAAESGQTYEVE